MHKQFKKTMNFTNVHDPVETGMCTNRLAQHKVTWVYKPARMVLQFKPNEDGDMYPENFNPRLVVLLY